MAGDAAVIETNGHEPSYLDYKGKHSGIMGWLLSKSLEMKSKSKTGSIGIG